MPKTVLLFWFSLIVACQSMTKDQFFNKYCNYIGGKQEDLFCFYVDFSLTDEAETFKREFTNVERIEFKRGNVGVVNSDFFKHFPNLKHITFNHVKIDLRPSENVTLNTSIEKVSIIDSTISGNHRTNAFHSLSELKSITLDGCKLENKTIDRELLRMNKNLVNISMETDRFYVKPQVPFIKHIDDDAFDNLDKIESLRLLVYDMTRAPARWYRNKPLNEVFLTGFQEFPKHIPVQIEKLHVSISHVKQISKDDLKSLRNLRRLDIISGDLEVIDEDAFDNLKKLERLVLNVENIRMFSARHFKNLKNLYYLRIYKTSKLVDLSFLNALSFNLVHPMGIYEREHNV